MGAETKMTVVRWRNIQQKKSSSSEARSKCFVHGDSMHFYALTVRRQGKRTIIQSAVANKKNKTAEDNQEKGPPRKSEELNTHGRDALPVRPRMPLEMQKVQMKYKPV